MPVCSAVNKKRIGQQARPQVFLRARFWRLFYSSSSSLRITVLILTSRATQMR